MVVDWLAAGINPNTSTILCKTKQAFVIRTVGNLVID
jgi:hypothetical protein